MFVTVIHHIHDPEGFQAAEAKALEAGLPSHVALPIHAATDDHKLGMCIWEGESVDAVREVVEGAVGPWAKNEYFEMHVDGLTPQLGVVPDEVADAADGWAVDGGVVSVMVIGVKPACKSAGSLTF
jgi:hypothetical protein